jgi:hypothetical protein
VREKVAIAAKARRERRGGNWQYIQYGIVTTRGNQKKNEVVALLNSCMSLHEIFCLPPRNTDIARRPFNCHTVAVAPYSAVHGTSSSEDESADTQRYSPSPPRHRKSAIC